MQDQSTEQNFSASKRRLRWEQVPPPVKRAIEQLAGGWVVAAVNCEGGFSPGLASRLRLAGGRWVFVKAIDAEAWPDQAVMYRAESRVSASLPLTVPAPRLLRALDDGRWVVLIFECIDGCEPDLRRNPADAFRVAADLADLARPLTPSPIAAPADHPRLGGWAELARDRERLASLRARSRSAADHLSLLITLEEVGLEEANGRALVHFDAYPHNPEPIVTGYHPAASTDPHIIDAVLAAHAGFCVGGSLYRASPALAPVTGAKVALGTAATTWLQGRLARRGT